MALLKKEPHFAWWVIIGKKAPLLTMSSLKKAILDTKVERKIYVVRTCSTVGRLGKKYFYDILNHADTLSLLLACIMIL